MNENQVKSLESNKRHFCGCAIVALGLMLFMWGSANLQDAPNNRDSMNLVATLSGVFLCVFIYMVWHLGKLITEEKQKVVGKAVNDWYNGY